MACSFNFIKIHKNLIHIVFMILTSLCAYGQTYDTSSVDLYSMPFEQLLKIKIYTASKHSETIQEAHATVYVITEKEIIENGFTSLEDVMQNVPGFETIKFGYFLVGSQRGFINNFSRTIIMINGREMQFYSSGEMFISNQFATHNIKQIEFMNGPGSALYGANSMLGVINIVTKNDQKEYNKCEVQAEYGTQRTKGLSLTFGHEIKNLRVSGSIRLYESNNWDFGSFVNDSVQFWDGTDRIAAGATDADHPYLNQARSLPISLKSSYLIRNNLSFYAGTESYYASNGKGNPTVNLRYDRNQDVRTSNMNYAGIEYTIKPNLILTAEYQHYIQKQWGHNARYDPRKDWTAYVKQNGKMKIVNGDTTYIPPNNPVTDEEVSKYLTGTYSNANSCGSKRDNAYVQLLSEFPKFHIKAVSGYRFDRFNITQLPEASALGYEDTYPKVDESKNTIYYKHALYTQLSKAIFSQKLSLSLGARIENHSRYHNIFVLRSGIVYSPTSKTTVKAMYGQAFSDPSVYELGINTNLKPSKINTTELGFSQLIIKSIRFNSTIYYNKAKDFIQRTGDNGSLYNDNTPVETAGLETQINYDLAKFSGKVSYSYVKSFTKTIINETSYENINQYQHITGLSFNYKIIRYLNINANTNIYDAITARHGNPTVNAVIVMPAYALVHLSLSSEGFYYGGLKLKFQLRVSNVFDKRDAYVPNTTVSGPKQFLQPGRQLIGKIMFEF